MKQIDKLKQKYLNLMEKYKDFVVNPSMPNIEWKKDRKIMKSLAAKLDKLKGS